PVSATTCRSWYWLLAPVVLLAGYALLLLALWGGLPRSALLATAAVIATDTGLWGSATLAAAIAVVVRHVIGRRAGTPELLGLAGLATVAAGLTVGIVPLWTDQYLRGGVAGAGVTLVVAIVG